MSCTTILVGKKASWNGSTMISRNDDCSSGTFTPKELKYIPADAQPEIYKSVLSHVTIPLPKDPMGYSAMPNPDPTIEGIWAAGGINEANVAMTATETITSNVRVLGADPYVRYIPAKDSPSSEEIPGGIGEEDIVSLVLPYIHNAKEGVVRLGNLLETYGTYEPNGIAFSDVNDIWYLETIGGHHWIARKLPEDCYAVIANQFSLDYFDLEDALTNQENYMCSADLKDFIEANHLDLTFGEAFNARLTFGSHSDSDHVYNTPRVWYGQRYFNPNGIIWDGPNAKYTPVSDNLPWCLKPEFKITVQDVKTVLSSAYEGTVYDPYRGGKYANRYRPIGINRTSCTALMELRDSVPAQIAGVEWIGFGCNAYNAFVPQYTSAKYFPDYFTKTDPDLVDTNSFYWANRIIAAMADPYRRQCTQLIFRYQNAVGSKARQYLDDFERSLKAGQEISAEDLAKVNEKIGAMVYDQTSKYLSDILYVSSMHMKDSFSLNDN